VQFGNDGFQIGANNELFADNNRANRSPQQQQDLNNFEFQARQQSVQRLSQGNSVKGTLSLGDVRVGAMTPLWIGGELFLVRWMTLQKKDRVQGVWLDWPRLRGDLLKLVEERFPAADLQPLSAPELEDPGRQVAGIPARFVPNSEPLAIIDPFSPLRMTLAAAWACALLASSAVGLLLFGVVRLSERRAAFVSAVTHELRTPLTTFRMYAEMLAGGMVRQPEKQREYLDTLRLESDRLSHLVENVLSYARLERGRSPRRLKGVPVPELITHVERRLRDRAKQSGLELSIEIAPDAAPLAVRCDPPVVEQILLNLVDNACKYAAVSSPAVIHLEAFARGKSVCLRVRDHGPGIAPADRSRVFQPFRKSAHEAALSAPGVGLGLALCRRLARALGGDLQLEDQPAGGAALVVMLRRASTC
jgi:signal transduction histidine kinase